MSGVLVVACSARKLTTEPGYKLAAFRTYDGPAWRTLRPYVHIGSTGWLETSSGARVWALSARYGLIPATTPIEWYDDTLATLGVSMLEARLDELAERSQEWALQFHTDCRAAMSPPSGERSRPAVLFGGKIYERLFSRILGRAQVSHWLEWRRLDGPGIGYQLGELKRWLEETCAENDDEDDREAAAKAEERGS